MCLRIMLQPTGICYRYAWVVVAAGFGISILGAGYSKSFGITNLLLLEYFPDVSGAAAGSIMGLLNGTSGLLSE